MISEAIALFGEAEKGDFQRPYMFRSLPQLLDVLGNPPPDSRGLHLAIQSLMYERGVLFFRVEEEGFSLKDYYFGLDVLKSEKLPSTLSGICAPGVGDSELIDAMVPICVKHHSILIISESDLYDYLN